MTKKLSTVLIVATLAAGCSSSDGNGPPETREAEFELVWSDEFEGAQGLPPDASRWTFDIGTGPNFDGFGNAQLEFNTDLPDNVALDGQGNLAITAQRVAFEDRPTFLDRAYTAGRITTKGKFATRFGRIEARMRLPAGRGMWPAFWMLGDTFPEVTWPGPGEIDIMEFRGQDVKSVYGTIHGPGYCGSPFDCGLGPIGGVFRFDGVLGFDDRFHVFAIEWDPERIAWFVDDQLFLALKPANVVAAGGDWVFNQPFFLLLNLAVGGSFALASPDDSTRFPATFLIDYVRVLKRVRGGTEPVEVVDIDDGTRDIPSPTSIDMQPDRTFIGIGGAEQLTVVDAQGQAVANGVEWSTDNPRAVRVGGTGVVYGARVGEATITASVNGVSDSITVTVSSTIAPPNRIQLPMAVDDFYPGRSSFGAVVGQAQGGPPLHTEDDRCPMRADDAVGECHRLVWSGRDSEGGTSPAFTGDFWTIGGAFASLQSRLVQRGATALSFVAWGANGGERISFGAGLAANDGADDTRLITLTTQPTRYTVPFIRLINYDEVFSPFGWSAVNGNNPNGFIVYVDDIQWINQAQ